MTDVSERQKYMMRGELAEEVANLVGIDTYHADRENTRSADFRRDELEQIYEAVTGEPGEELSQREMNYLMMRELGTELSAAYPYDLNREDLKVIHRALIEDNKESES